MIKSRGDNEKQFSLLQCWFPGESSARNCSNSALLLQFYWDGQTTTERVCDNLSIPFCWLILDGFGRIWMVLAGSWWFWLILGGSGWSVTISFPLCGFQLVNQMQLNAVPPFVDAPNEPKASSIGLLIGRPPSYTDEDMGWLWKIHINRLKYRSCQKMFRRHCTTKYYAFWITSVGDKIGTLPESLQAMTIL